MWPDAIGVYGIMLLCRLRYSPLSARFLARLSPVWPPMVGRMASGRSCNGKQAATWGAQGGTQLSTALEDIAALRCMLTRHAFLPDCCGCCGCCHAQQHPHKGPCQVCWCVWGGGSGKQSSRSESGHGCQLPAARSDTGKQHDIMSNAFIKQLSCATLPPHHQLLPLVPQPPPLLPLLLLLRRTLSRICSTSSGVMGPMYVASAMPGSVMMVAWGAAQQGRYESVGHQVGTCTTKPTAHAGATGNCKVPSK